MKISTTVLCAFALLCMGATAQAQQHAAMTIHVPEAVSSDVAPLIGHLPDLQRLSLAISLPLRNEAELDDLLQRIYDPQSPSFHKYLSVEEFTDRFGPTESDHEAVLHFAQTYGLAVIDVSANRMVVDVEGSAENIEKAFHVALGIYQHPTESRTFYAPDREPSVDIDVAVLHVSGLDNFTQPHAKNVRPSPESRSDESAASKTTGSGPFGQFIGSDMRAAYYGTGSLDGAGQSVGLFEYAGYEISDVKTYFKNVKQALTVPVKGVSLNGAHLGCPPSTCDDSEQVIDIETTISMAPGLKQVVVYVGFNDVSIFNRMAVDNTSKQLSCSWGWNDDESSLDPIFKEMAAQGQTVFVASGDNGSATPGDVVWPADDPYITSVGGTDLVTTGPGGAWKSETGWNGSAGMASKNKIPIPSYQQIAGVINSRNHGSKTLRDIPDVAAEANTNQYSCYDGGCFGGNGGTSYAAPQWAGLTAMANQQALAGGGTALGFLNPALYAIGTGANYDSDFHDIDRNSNGRYTAVTGFDLVTGWGSPNGVNLIGMFAGID
ncbi:MAG: S53 family peptidase [Candidatus Sulfotelmatobacter sp.]